jgi:hypothetical protein
VSSSSSTLTGTVVILPKTPASALRGILASKTRKHATNKEMEAAIASQATAGFRRRKQS